MPWGFSPRHLVFLSDGNDALVVVEKAKVSPGITAQAWLAMIKVGT